MFSLLRLLLGLGLALNWEVSRWEALQRAEPKQCCKKLWVKASLLPVLMTWERTARWSQSDNWVLIHVVHLRDGRRTQHRPRQRKRSLWELENDLETKPNTAWVPSALDFCQRLHICQAFFSDDFWGPLQKLQNLLVNTLLLKVKRHLAYHKYRLVICTK